MLKMIIINIQQIIHFLCGDFDLIKIALILMISGTNQGILLQIRNRENNTLIIILQNESFIAPINSRHDNMTALNKT
ncbi:hypothetical protein SDC9_183799 [bioreactor metagenome]|uniref:Uncharacterized protein n=1 Tax=bioreactor metagenome TaxID=1076179 RepID=A0A645HC44_9ZZZZ